jgi:peptidoglycan/xylan/chitin deacetylase (PgdA/CDA1 family)
MATATKIPRKSDRLDPRAGNRHPRQVHRVVTKLSGRRPTGYVAPWWEFSTVTNELLLERGIKYDHSLMHNDFHPYYVRVGDSWTKIDYARRPAEWMMPLKRGHETDLIEIPTNWYLDEPAADDVHQEEPK